MTEANVKFITRKSLERVLFLKRISIKARVQLIKISLEQNTAKKYKGRNEHEEPTSALPMLAD